MATRAESTAAFDDGQFVRDKAAAPGPNAGLSKRRSDMLIGLATALLEGRDADRVVLPGLYRALAAERIVDASLGFIVTDVGKSMTLGFIEGFPADVIQQCLTLDFGQAVCGTVAATRAAMHVTDIQRSLDPMAELVRSAGINAYACEPLIAHGRLLGTLSFASRSRRSFDAEDLLFFRSVAKLVAIARDRARVQARAKAMTAARAPPEAMSAA